MIAAVKSSEESGNMFSGLSLVQNSDVGNHLPLSASSVQMATDMSIISKFPTVPTAPIIIESVNNSNNAVRKEEVVSFSSEIAVADIAAKSFTNVPVVKDVKKKPANFSTLYAAEVYSFALLCK